MRIAFVGLSTPLFYDYRNLASKALSDLSDSPNPILDSPYGLMLFYDQIWFLCRSLCPENMRKLDYVKFLDEEKKIPSLKDINLESVFKRFEKQSPELYVRYHEATNRFFSQYGKNLLRVGVHWEGGPDNHTHGLKIGDITTSANSASISSLLFDMEVVKRISKKVELITNSFSQSWIQDTENSLVKIKLTELLTVENIPNYLTPSGPYHACIEEARNDTFINDFRKWAGNISIDKDPDEIMEMKKNIDIEIKKSQDEIFLKYLDPKTLYWSLGKTVVGEATSLVIPGASAVIEIGDGIKSYVDNKNRRWQGFIVSSKRKLNK